MSFQACLNPVHVWEIRALMSSLSSPTECPSAEWPDSMVSVVLFLRTFFMPFPLC